MMSSMDWIDVGAFDAIPKRGARMVRTSQGCIAVFRTASDDVYAIDNACPTTGVTQAGASKDDLSKEKLEWSDVFDLAEWFRPGTTAKKADFDPNKM